MSSQKYVIELDAGAEGATGFVEPDDADWLEQRLRRSGPTRVRILSDDAGDTEGHAARRSIAVRAILEGDDDTEGHAISIHFPSASEADAFRKRMMLTGVLAGTVALGAVAGVGVANLSSGDAGAGAAQGTGQYATENLGGTQAATSTATGSDWTQAERPGQAGAAASGATTGSDWTQAERPGASSATSSSEDDDVIPPGIGGPTPR